ncbi:MAG: DUF1624 domain-containing protein [Firmicutes bacterium]|nr:DUF1624 domain-containing protein [Bacillota bacterium]
MTEEQKITQEHEFPKNVKKRRSDRIWEIDFLRGLCILLVIMDHLLFNFTQFDGFSSMIFSNAGQIDSPFFNAMIDFAIYYRGHAVQTAVRFAIVFVFILVSGVSCAFSKNNGKRILKLLIGTSLITLMTIVVFLIENIPTPNAARQVSTSDYVAVIFASLALISSITVILTILNKGRFSKKRFFFISTIIIGLMFAHLLFLVLFLIRRHANKHPSGKLANVLELGSKDWFILVSSLIIIGLWIIVIHTALQYPIAPIHREGIILPGNSTIIVFGILFIVALSVFIYTLAKKVWDNKWFFLCIGIVVLILGFTFGGFESGNLVPATREWSFNSVMSNLVGTLRYGGDFYGILPWTGMFFVGVFFGKVLYSDRKTCLPALIGTKTMFTRSWHMPITFCGKRTMFVYLLHQPVVIGLMGIMAFVAGYRIF